jgi:hypothetical protein
VQVPSDLPPAKLYLDDVAEIVQLFSSQLPLKPDSAGGWLPCITKFEVGQKQCNDIDDLPKIARETIDFKIEVQRERYNAITLSVRRYSTSWSGHSLNDDLAWSTARQLQAIFKPRQRHLRKFLEGLYLLPIVLGGLLSVVIPLIHSNTKAIDFFIIALVLYVVVFITVRRHTLVVFRYGSDLAARRDERIGKIVQIGATAILAVLGTLTVQFLVHRWWPK